MMDKQVTFVTGACGWIGRQVCKQLKNTGHTVIALDRVEQEGPWDRLLRSDISRNSGLPPVSETKALPDHARRVLIHCAGHAHRPVETPEEIRLFHEVNSRGTQRVVDWARTVGIDRILYLSSIAFYEWQDQPVTEEHAVMGHTAYAKSKLEGEGIVSACGLDYRIVRLATVFGEGDRANFSRLAKALKARRFVLPGNGQARKSVISIRRASEWIVQFSMMERPEHQLVNLGFRNAPSLDEICRAFHEVCGFGMPKSVPVSILMGMGTAGDLISRVKPNFPLTRSTVRKLTQSTWVDCRRAASMFDIDHDFSTALRESAGYYQTL